MTNDVGRMLVFFGVILVAVGVVLMFADRIPFMGRLPGDFVLRRKNVTVFIPLASMIVVSLLLTLLLNLFNRK